MASAAHGTVTNHFTQLNWSELRIDSILPVYTEVVPLETDYRTHEYQVLLEYPEYAPLSKAEITALLPFDSLLSDKIQINTNVGVSRKKGMMDISFIPIVKENGHYKKLLSAKISIVARPSAKKSIRKSEKTSTDINSVLANGRWVKISIKEDGIYSLTRTALKKMGFSNPEKVRLYGYGGHRQKEIITNGSHYTDLQEVPLFRQSTDSWLFWGNGLLYWDGDKQVVNHYANYACYFLCEADEPAQLQTAPTPEGTVKKTYTTFRDHVLYEKDEYAWFTGGRELFENLNYATSNSHTYKLSTHNSAGNEELTIRFTAAADKNTIVTPTVNGQTLKQMNLSAISKYIYATQATHTTDVSKQAKGNDWTVKLTSTSGHDARLDYISLHYDRELTLPSDAGFLVFSQTGNGISAFQIKCTPANTRILCTDQVDNPATLIEGKENGNTLTVTVSDPKRRYVAFDVTHQFPEPTFVGTVENQNLHAIDSVDMVIVVPASGKLTAQATRLAEAHAQYDGLKTAVVRADQIYNEFSSGTPDATAYRRFMKMLYDKAEDADTAPRYLLLMGDCAWDNRMVSTAWRNHSPEDYLLCYQSENSFSDIKCYIMEDYFGLLDDGEGINLLTEKTDLGVGRFPVTTAEEARIMVDKVITYISRQNAGVWKNLVYMLGDDGDDNQHMDHADKVANRIIATNPELEVKKIMWDSYTRVSTNKSNTYPEVTALLKKQMDQGAMVMNYTGHANATSLSHEYVLTAEDFSNTRGTCLPLWVTAACDVTPYDGLAVNNGESAVLNAHGGALAFYGTTRTVYASQNLTMNRYFMQYLFGTDSEGKQHRLGDAIRLSKAAIINSETEFNYKENKLHYALLGDPALTIGAITHRIVLDKINDTDLAPNKPVSLKAGQKVRLMGHVENLSGMQTTDFTGTLTIRLFDSNETVTCKNNTGAESAFTYSDRVSMLYESEDSIVNGKFELSLLIPLDINYSDENGRFVFYAVNDAKTAEANGYCENFTLGGISDSQSADTLGPQITAYLNSEEFVPGDVVNSSPYFVAQLTDPSGINVNGNGIGHNLELSIDGLADRTYNLNDYLVREFGDFTRGTVSFSIPTLESGKHTLTFRAWDLLNNTSTYTTEFTVDAAMKPEMLQLTASQNPATESTTFLVTHDMPGSECTFTIDVYDFMGRRLWTTTQKGSSAGNVYSIPWNLTTGAGGKLGSGVYFYRCQMQSGESQKVSKTQKIIVLNNK